MNSRNASPARSLTPLSRAASSDKGSAAEAQPNQEAEAASKRAESSSSASTISCEAVAVPKRALPKSPPRAKAKAANRPGVAGDASRGAGPKASSSGPRPKSKSEVRKPGAAKAKAAIQLPGTESRGGSTSSTQPEVTQNSGLDGSTKHSGEEQEGACSPMTPTTPILETIKRRHVKLSTIESVGNVQDDTPPAASASVLPGLPDEASASQGEESPIDSAVGHVTTCFSSWRQLSLGSLSSGGLPTILTHLSESKKGIENEERDPDPPEPEAAEAAEAPTPCAEPEPAPSPDRNPHDPEGFAGAIPQRLDARPALVINIPPGDNNALRSEEVNPTLTAPAGAQLDEREYRLLWESVVQGDIQMLQEFMTRGRLQSGRLCDMNGHSIFWNALAYQQQQVAMFLLHHFPPGSAQGIDLWEVHQRRKDTLLHLCVYFQYFSAPVAELFEVLFLGMGQVDSNSFQAYWNRANADSDTFLHCAAARRNFWVMRYVASHAGEILFRNGRTSALEVLLEKLEEVGVSCPTADFPEMEVKRSWMDFSRYLPMAEPTAFADMELEVQQSTGTYRVAAHRCVLGAASGVLHQELSAAGRVLLIDPLSCRSSKVLDTVLTFIYSSRISCDYREDGCLLWQLLCLCARYQLPEPLWRYARSALLLAVKNAVFTALATIPLLLEAKREVGLSESEACFIAHAYLRSAEASEALRDTSPKCNEAVFLALEEIELQAMSLLAN